MSDNKFNEIDTAMIAKNVLQNMQDGVIAVSLSGEIITLNPAAAKIFMLEDVEYTGEHFTKIFSKFLTDPRNDELNDGIFSAIFESAVTHHKDVKYYANGSCKELLLSSTALIVEHEDKSKTIGVIFVVSDITERQRLAHVQDVFGKYIDPRIASRLIDYPEEDLMKANRQMMTVSFCDMNNFTNLCQTLAPTTMEKLMNNFFSKMSHAVHNTEGVIDKFIGDSVMSFWGQPFTEKGKHAINGCQTALDQLASMAEFNIESKGIIRDLRHNINISIGVATGELIIANIGSKDRMSFTVMGNIVNIASRLVGANKVYGTSILVSDYVEKSARSIYDFREVDIIRAKGMEQPTRIYELLGLKGCLTDQYSAYLENYAKGLASYRQCNWVNATKHFEQALHIIPQDKASLVFLERIGVLKDHPPIMPWDGVWILDRK